MANYPYIPIRNEGEFPIIGILISPWGREVTLDDMTEMVDAGFTAGTINLDSPPDKDTHQSEKLGRALDIASDEEFQFYYDLPIIPLSGLFRTPENLGKVATIIKKYRDSDLLGAWYISDEPSYYDFDKLQGCYNQFKELDTNHMTFFVLAATDSEQYIGDTGSYSNFLDEIQARFKPAVWVYDLYPFVRVNGGQLEIKYNEFFKYLDLFSKVSKKTERPFWAFLMSTPHRNCIHSKDTGEYTGYNLQPAPTRGMLLFEAFGAIAYGARGLMYYTYGQTFNVERVLVNGKIEPVSTISKKPIPLSENKIYDEIYESAPVNTSDEETELWDLVKEVNDYIKKYCTIFVSNDLVEVVHAGKSYNGKPVSYAPFACLKSYSTGVAGVVMTHFSKGKTNYLLIVNQDPLNSQTVTLTIDSKYVVFEVTADHSGNVPPVGPVVPQSISSKGTISPDPNPSTVQGTIMRELEPGGIIILRYNS